MSCKNTKRENLLDSQIFPSPITMSYILQTKLGELVKKKTEWNSLINTKVEKMAKQTKDWQRDVGSTIMDMKQQTERFRVAVNSFEAGVQLQQGDGTWKGMVEKVLSVVHKAAETKGRLLEDSVMSVSKEYEKTISEDLDEIDRILLDVTTCIRDLSKMCVTLAKDCDFVIPEQIAIWASENPEDTHLKGIDEDHFRTLDRVCEALTPVFSSAEKSVEVEKTVDVLLSDEVQLALKDGNFGAVKKLWAHDMEEEEKKKKKKKQNEEKTEQGEGKGDESEKVEVVEGEATDELDDDDDEEDEENVKHREWEEGYANMLSDVDDGNQLEKPEELDTTNVTGSDNEGDVVNPFEEIETNEGEDLSDFEDEQSRSVGKGKAGGRGGRAKGGDRELSLVQERENDEVSEFIEQATNDCNDLMRQEYIVQEEPIAFAAQALTRKSQRSIRKEGFSEKVLKEWAKKDKLTCKVSSKGPKTKEFEVKEDLLGEGRPVPFATEKPYMVRCQEEKCNYSASSYSTLNKHVQIDHDSILKKIYKSDHTAKTRPLCCTYCGQVFPLSIDDEKKAKDCRLSHLPVKTDESFMCLLCANKEKEKDRQLWFFGSHAMLRDHLSSKHYIGDWACPVSDISTTSSTTQRQKKIAWVKSAMYVSNTDGLGRKRSDPSKKGSKVWACLLCKDPTSGDPLYFQTYKLKVDHYIKTHPKRLARCQMPAVRKKLDTPEEDKESTKSTPKKGKRATPTKRKKRGNKKSHTEGSDSGASEIGEPEVQVGYDPPPGSDSEEEKQQVKTEEEKQQVKTKPKSPDEIYSESDKDEDEDAKLLRKAKEMREKCTNQ